MAKAKGRSMGKLPGRSVKQSSTRKTGKCSPKLCCNVLDIAMRGDVPKVKRTRRAVESIGTNCASDMPLCPTGIACIFGRDGAQNLVCIPVPTGGTKCLKADPNGFFLANC